MNLDVDMGRFCAEMQALIDGRVLCVHGGLSPDLRTLDQVSSWSTTLWRCMHGVVTGACQKSASAVDSLSSESSLLHTDTHD